MIMKRTMTPATAFVVSEVKVSYVNKVKASERTMICCSEDTYRVLLRAWEMDTLDLQESFCVLMLNRANQVLALYRLSTGGITGTVADPRLVFAAALKVCACSIILAHNHPSGSLKPSRADEELTRKIKEAGRMLDISVLDHLILTSETYLSFADEGLL